MFHCGVGNTDRPNRWTTINRLFTDLGKSLATLGHEVFMMVHPQAQIPRVSDDPITVIHSTTVDKNFIREVSPDVAITWNGNSDGDRVFIEEVGRDKMIFGELGFFGHYDKTCYFDRCGVNTQHSIIGTNFSMIATEEDNEICDKLETQFIKPRLCKEPYIFVPMQDETDTQITQYSPFKTMNEFLEQVFNIFRFDDRKILYKRHPLAPAPITLEDPRLIEVTEDVHHYIPYADFVFGLNSTVMVETLLYHSHIITYGCGIASRHFANGIDRKAFISEMYRRQLKWDDLKNPEVVKNSHLNTLLI